MHALKRPSGECSASVTRRRTLDSTATTSAAFPHAVTAASRRSAALTSFADGRTAPTVVLPSFHTASATSPSNWRSSTVIASFTSR